MASAARRRPHFFKVFLPQLSSHHLEIPPAFLKHVEAEASRSMISLRGPGGHTCGVELVKKGTGMALESGWEEFVADHCLAHGDFLVFRYDGRSQFTVLVFDPSACEKEEAFRAASHTNSIVLEESEEEEMAVRVSKKRRKTRIYTHKKRSRSKSNGKSDVIGTNKRRTSDFLALVQHGQSGEAISMPHPQICLRPPKQQVAAKKLDVALERAKSFKSKNPFVPIVMQASYVYFCFYLHFPVKFVREHLPKSNTQMTLWDQNRRPWNVTYLNRGGLSAGWGKFSRAHNLEKGDVCIFELIQRNQMQVHIFRMVRRPHH